MTSARAEFIRDVMMGQSKFQGLTIDGQDIVSEFENGGRCEKIYDQYILCLDRTDEAISSRVRALVDQMLELCILHAAEYGAALEKAEQEGIAPAAIERVKTAAPHLLEYLK